MVHICLNNGKTELMPCEFKKKKQKTKKKKKKYEEMVNWI